MLPILSSGIEGRRVSIYNRADGSEHPMRGVEIKNTSGLQLMPGPISVFDSAAYAGDAQIGHVTLNDKRRLAYAVRRFYDGIYVLMIVEGGGPAIHELERRLRVTEPVIKFLTVRVDEEQKRLGKIKALRDAKKKVSAQPAAAAEEPPAAPAAETPATA